LYPDGRSANLLLDIAAEPGPRNYVAAGAWENRIYRAIPNLSFEEAAAATERSMFERLFGGSPPPEACT